MREPLLPAIENPMLLEFLAKELPIRDCGPLLLTHVEVCFDLLS